MDQAFVLKIFKKEGIHIMANTLVIPELFSEAVNSKMEVSLRVGRLATDMTDLAEDIRTCGDTIHFPTFDRISDAAEVTKGTPIVPEEVNMSDSTAKIKQVGKSVRIYDKDSIQVKGAMKDRMADQIGEVMAKDVDKNLIDEMDASAVYKVPTSMTESITKLEIEAAFDCFGDDVDSANFAGILINHRLRSAFVSMDEFTSVSKTYAKDGNGVVEDGVVGYWLGVIPVIICDNNTYDATAKECKTYLVRKNALGVIWQKEVTIEEEREGKLFATDLIASDLYAVKLMDTKGCVVLRKTVA